MVQSINLVPQEEIQEQTKIKVVKLSSVFAILLFFVVAGVAGFMYYQKYQLDLQKAALDGEIAGLRDEIKGMSELEIVARNHTKKVAVLRGLMDNRVYYSKLVNELRGRETDDIKITTFDYSGSNLNISGTCSSLVSLSEYISNLLNRDGSKGSEELKSLFTSVRLGNVTLQKADSKFTFSLQVSYDVELLRSK